MYIHIAASRVPPLMVDLREQPTTYTVFAQSQPHSGIDPHPFEKLKVKKSNESGFLGRQAGPVLLPI